MPAIGAALFVVVVIVWAQFRSDRGSPSSNRDLPVASAIAEDFTLSNVPRLREISSLVRHRYHVYLQAGQYVRLTVEHHGIDVSASLFAPNGAVVAAITY